MKRLPQRWQWIAAALVSMALAAAAVVWLNLRGDGAFAGAASTVEVTPQLIERGAYLARAGNCASCHTQRGGAPYAGGRAIRTPFGTVFTSNLTPHDQTGIGAWTAGDFWRALHNGRSRDGRLLYPAFPYPNMTRVTRADADAIHAFLRTLPAVDQSNRAHALRFPYDTQVALALWRALFFRPGVFEPTPDRGDDWNRGAYLVRGLGHCEACHAPRNLLGATAGDGLLAGGLMPSHNWYAPSLVAADEAGVQAWRTEDVIRLLKTGTSLHGSVLGPMAEVVFGSTQYLNADDLRSIAVYLQTLPTAARSADASPPASADSLARGRQIYEGRCADCHGTQGEGAAGAYPPLAGNRKVTGPVATNLVRVIVGGGFPPVTPGHPRPYGMPPFGHVLDNAQIADVITYIRSAWGNRAGAVQELDVLRSR